VKIISYRRVSTKKQGQSGLGLDGQQAALEAYVRQHGATCIATYTEVETGKRSDRPELIKAIAHAKRSKARLVVAKLDRLARNVEFTAALMRSGVDFVACDNPHANKLTIHILAAIAEHEAEQIAERTKTALQAAKRRGIKLGSARPGHWAGREQARLQGARKGNKAAGVALAEAADEAYSDLYPMLLERRKQGMTFQRIADNLNENGHTTRRGKPWNASQVLRVLRRAV
jgi:DNA invertase Pin-like site-specific DNA recombinase